MAEIKFTEDNFAEYLASDNLIVIDFWATWCGPCQRLTPIIAQVAEEYDGKPVTIGKCNAEDNEELTNKYGIRSIPTILFIKNNEVVDELHGAVNKLKITDTVDKHL